MIKYSVNRIGIVILFLGIPYISNAQITNDTSAAFRLIRNNELMIGAYGGPNYTFANGFEGGPNINAYVGTGYYFCLNTKLKLPEGLFINSGISYEMQNYKLSEIGGSNILPSSNTYPYSSIGFQHNNDQYTCTFNSYNIGIPLTFGYGITRRKWSFYFALGVDFYYNSKNEESLVDDTKGLLLEQATFYHPIELLKTQDIYSPFNMINYYSWYSFYAYGLVNMGISYKVSQKLSLALEPTLRFTNLFVPPHPINVFSSISGLSAFSLSLGINYSFQFEDNGSFKPIDDDKEKRGFIFGFHIIPTAEVDVPFPYSGYFYFCYAFTTQFTLSNRFAIETGIVEDNEYFNYALIGVPVLAKYYFSSKANKNSFYLAAGCHIDYTAPIGFIHNFYGQYILPIGLLESGYEVTIGNKVVLDFAIGYKNWLNTITLSGSNSFNPFTLTGYSHGPYASVGFGYRFK